MTDEQKGHIKRFANNPALVDAVFYVIRETFLKSKSKREVLQMAAERLAVEMLDEAKRDIAQFEDRRQEARSEVNQGM